MFCSLYSLQLDFQHYLNDPDLKLMEQVVQLLCGITVASAAAAVCVLPQVIPLLLKRYSVTAQVSWAGGQSCCDT